MSRKQQTRIGVRLDGPIVILVLCWLLIWKLWPDGGAPNDQALRTRDSARIVYGPPHRIHLFERPDLHTLPFHMGIQKSKVAPTLRPLAELPGDDTASSVKISDNGQAITQLVRPEMIVSGFPVRIPDAYASPLDGASLDPVSVYTWLSPALRRAGIELPEDRLSRFLNVGGSFEAELSVIPTSLNWVPFVHVFVEKSTGSPDIDKGLIALAREVCNHGQSLTSGGRIVISVRNVKGDDT